MVGCHHNSVYSAEQSYETASTGEQHTSLLLQVKGDGHFLLECSLAFSRSSDPRVSKTRVHQTKFTVESMPQVRLAQTFLAESSPFLYPTPNPLQL